MLEGVCEKTAIVSTDIVLRARAGSSEYREGERGTGRYRCGCQCADRGRIADSCNTVDGQPGNDDKGRAYGKS